MTLSRLRIATSLIVSFAGMYHESNESIFF